MLDGFSDVVTLDYMDRKYTWTFPTHSEGHKAHILTSWLLVDYRVYIRVGLSDVAQVYTP